MTCNKEWHRSSLFLNVTARPTEVFVPATYHMFDSHREEIQGQCLNWQTSTFMSLSCQKCFPSNCFFSNPEKWKFLSAMSELDIPSSVQGNCCWQIWEHAVHGPWDNNDRKSLRQDKKVEAEWVQILGLSSLLDSNMCVLLEQMPPSLWELRTERECLSIIHCSVGYLCWRVTHPQILLTEHPSYESFHSCISQKRTEVTRINLAIFSTGKKRKIP
jgi:hypothetical protein